VKEIPVQLNYTLPSRQKNHQEPIVRQPLKTIIIYRHPNKGKKTKIIVTSINVKVTRLCQVEHQVLLYLRASIRVGTIYILRLRNRQSNSTDGVSANQSPMKIRKQNSIGSSHENDYNSASEISEVNESDSDDDVSASTTGMIFFGYLCGVQKCLARKSGISFQRIMSAYILLAADKKRSREPNIRTGNYVVKRLQKRPLNSTKEKMVRNTL
jgi:hypothetical protein